jgi:molecular chaperone GrpE
MDDSKIEAGPEINAETYTAPNATSEAGSIPQEATAQQAGAQQDGAEEGTPASQADVDYAALIAEFEVALADERARADKLLEQTQRMAAEFQNSRRRQEAQLSDEIERASAHVIKRLLPVIDDFDLAFAHVPPELAEGATWVEGFRQIQKKLHNILVEEGVTVIRGEGEFDPTLHEAFSSEPSDGVPSGHVIAPLRAGYTYKGKVLRPALVRVAM